MPKKPFKWVFAAVILMAAFGSTLFWLLSHAQSDNHANRVGNESTLTATLTASPTETVLPSETATPSSTPSSTLTATLTASYTPTSTATLATLVVQLTAINPDVTLLPISIQLPTSTPTPLPTLVVPSPLAKVATLPPGDTPLSGWFAYDIDHLTIQRTGKWERYTTTYRSTNRHYLYSDDPEAKLTLRFLGGAARVRYAKFHSYGVFDVRIDGQTVTTVDSYLPPSSPNGDFLTTEVFGLPHGWHTLEIRRLDRRNPASSGGFIAIDGIDVFLNGPAPTTVPTNTPIVPSPTPSPAPAQKIQVLSAPPTVQPTTTPAPPQLTAISLTVAYDLNGNKAVDPNEGVQQLSVHLVRADTNQVVASGFTDAQGYLRLEAAGTAPLRLVVPYFNRFWEVPPRTSGTRLTLLIPPVNQPALIP